MRNNKNLRNFYDLVNTMLVALSKEINAISQLLVLLIFTTFIIVNAQLQQQQNSQQPPAVQQSSPVVEKNFEQQQEEIVMAILVEAGNIECLYQPVINPKYNSFEIDYQVIEGGEITFSVKSPSGVIIVSDQKQMDGAHKINIDEAQNGRGDYALCFDNSFSYTGAKRVFFEIFLLDKDGNYLNDYDRKIQQDQGHGLLAEQLETFNIVTNKVKNNLNEVERMQSQFRAIEARDRSSIETAFERINFWSAIHLLSMLFAVGCQVYMVRSLFIEESRIGRFMRHGKLK